MVKNQRKQYKFVILSLVVIGTVFIAGCINQETQPNKNITQSVATGKATEVQLTKECISNWQCEGWSVCSSDGKQMRICNDMNNCGNETGKPFELQFCTPPCTENWNCGDWTRCFTNETQTRTCTDENKCSTLKNKLTVSQSCAYSRLVNETITKRNFEVTLIGVSYFKHLKYDTWGDEVTDFRADIKVKNIGTSSESFDEYDAAMIVGSSQYSRSYKSKFDGSKIYPGVIKEGYILYEDVPKNLSGQAKIIVGSSYFHAIDQFTWFDILYKFDVEL